jgi:hypothetical protein
VAVTPFPIAATVVQLTVKRSKLITQLMKNWTESLLKCPKKIEEEEFFLFFFPMKGVEINAKVL